ncbi:MAG: hypothetical protein BWY78_00488 [Alphaproteobacteria bacterium ADurb.Bin438]|nr:MAG: hypothetical protein BWY78_00488 [Alphaproteobacteria bacterium ADurb.Bin438]
MKKILIMSIILVFVATGILVAKEKGLLDKLIVMLTQKSEKKEEPVKKEIATDILDMDGFIVSVVKDGTPVASMELSFKIIMTVEAKTELNLARSQIRARMNAMIYDYLDKYYKENMDLADMKKYLIEQLQRVYGKDKIIDVLYAFYYIRPAA